MNRPDIHCPVCGQLFQFPHVCPGAQTRITLAMIGGAK